jgi:hypothetical protein
MFGPHCVAPLTKFEFCDERLILFDAREKMETVVAAMTVYSAQATISASKGHEKI